jgi:hypothetical protein
MGGAVQFFALLEDFRKARLEGFEPPTRGLGNRCSIP